MDQTGPAYPNGDYEDVLECGSNHFLDLETSMSQLPQFCRVLRRPWKAFWPPLVENDTYEWLLKTCPEVLSWRFDSNKTSDRPWRSWTRSVTGTQEENKCLEDQRSED